MQSNHYSYPEKNSEGVEAEEESIRIPQKGYFLLELGSEKENDEEDEEDREENGEDEATLPK